MQVAAQGFISTDKLPELVVCVVCGFMMRCGYKIGENKMDYANRARNLQ